MECKRCGNKDPRYFYKGSRGWYCRKCVKFKRLILEEESEPYEYDVDKESSEYNLAYPLTTYQADIALKTLATLKQGKDVLLNCVCGSGKTELVVMSISDYLRKGLKVCYAISRKEVVKELYERYKLIFNKAKVVALYGGHTKEEYGDLIVCTTHQLFRYYQTFDLLILDEVDAFPLCGNQELMNIAINSAKGNIIFSTATVNKFLKDNLKQRNYRELNLYIRPSLKPLIEPKINYGPKGYLLMKLMMIMHTMTNQCLIFVSSKSQARNYYRFFKPFFNCIYVYAGLENESQNIEDFKNHKYQFIFTTTVLERGITIKDVNVIILNFNDNVFNEENLIQMLGRVGRNFNNPYGESYILSIKRTNAINKAVTNLSMANRVYEMSIL